MAKLFDDLLLKGIKSGHMPARTAEARKWYRDKALGVGKIEYTSLFKEMAPEVGQNRSAFSIGNMYMFQYDPKHKSTLPYYDRIPLIFPVDRAKGGFYGINFHYLPYILRAKLMDALYEVTSNNRYDDKTKMKVSYQILSSATKFKEFRPTFKHYLVGHIRSKLIYIHPTEWDMAIFLDVARFEKASQTKVWEDSRRSIRGKK
jgi:hypothetical protein